MNRLPAPHGGKLIYRVNEEKNIDGMERIEISNDLAHDIENIAYGVFSPLEGFLCREDFENVLYNMRLSNDLPWTIPIVFDLKNIDVEYFLLRASYFAVDFGYISFGF